MKKILFLLGFLFFLLTWGTLGSAGQPANAPGKTPVDSAMDYVPGEILVRLAPDVDFAQAGVLAFYYSLGLKDRIATINLYRMEILDGTSEWEAARRVSLDRRVLYAEPNFIDHVSEYPARDILTVADTPDRVPSDTLYGQQWHYPLINMPAAWDRTTGNISIVTAVVDTGVRFDHPDLKGRLSSNGYDFIGIDNDPTDPDQGHGTHVSGTIGAATNNSKGVAGMTWRGTILPVRTLGTGGGTHFQFSQGFRYAAGLLAAPDPVNPTPAKVINYSGGGSDSQTKKDAVAAVNAARVVMACAAGNENGAITYPAAYSVEYPYVICVGATNCGNGTPTRAYYSNYGPAMNVVAPGGDTTVDSDGDGHPDGVLSSAWNFSTSSPTYEFWMGTSMATPHVTGLVALMLGRGCPASLIRAKLQNTATDLGAAGFDNYYGWGLINANLAVQTPDLIINYLLGLGAASRIALGSDQVVFKWRVRNRGAVPSGATAVKFWLSSDPTLGPGDVLLGSKQLAALAGGASTALTQTTFQLSNPVDPEAKWYVIGKVDPSNKVWESNETNNIKSGQLTDR